MGMATTQAVTPAPKLRKCQKLLREGSFSLNRSSYFIGLNFGPRKQLFYLRLDNLTPITWFTCDCVTPTSCRTAGTVLPERPPYNTTENGATAVLCDTDTCKNNTDRPAPGLKIGCQVADQIPSKLGKGKCEYLHLHTIVRSPLGSIGSLPNKDGTKVGKSYGIFYPENVWLTHMDGWTVSPELVVGCGMVQKGALGGYTEVPDGVFGLGWGKLSILSQMADLGVWENSFGLCFEGDMGLKGGSYLNLGDALIDGYSDTIPMRRIFPSPMFFVDLGEVRMGSKVVNVPAGTFGKPTPKAEGGVVVDPFTTVTRLPPVALLAINETLVGLMPNLTYDKGNSKTFGLICWKGAPYKQKKPELFYPQFPNMQLVFPNNTIFYVLPQSYLIANITTGKVCLAAAETTDSRTTIGGTHQHRAALACSGSMAAIAVPCNAAMAVPCNAAMAVPCNAAMAVPCNAAMAVPCNAAMAAPCNAAMAVPCNAAMAVPCNAAMAVPCNAAMAVPCNAAMAVPCNAAMAVPCNAAIAVPCNAATAVPCNAAMAVPCNAAMAVPCNAAMAVPCNAAMAVASFLRNKMVIYNYKDSTISWADMNCTSPPPHLQSTPHYHLPLPFPPCPPFPPFSPPVSLPFPSIQSRL
ncbi:unnamed protein product [Closterium sp. NIES-65]|nr:unnamed protein product [Closterium sp. NIES-65]